MNMPVSPARIRSPIVTIWRSISSAPAASRRSIRRSRRAMQPPREAECRRYEALCRSHPADLQILGVGHTGHIGFNEPADDFPELTHLVDLAPQTLAANAHYFDEPDTMPRQAITVGLGVLMRAKRILLLLSGSGKAEITERLLCGRIVPQVPATILRLHPDVTAVIDEDALLLVRAHAPNLIP